MKIYRVFSPDLDQTPEDARRVMAHDDEDAATLWGRRQDAESAEYTIAKGSDMVAIVCEEGTTTTASFIVTAETTPTYIARRM